MTRFAITIVAATALVTPAFAQSTVAGDNIVQVAAKAGQFNTLLAAAKAADLAGALSGKGPFTVFAPTDAAFAKLGKSTIADLLKPANKQKLADILKYHVVAGKVMSPTAVKLDSATALSGKKLPLSFDGKTLTVAGAKVVTADVNASNGVIHVIDSVMLPPAGPSIVDVAAKAGSFGTLLAAAKAAGLADTLGNGGPFTVFAPTDEAFAKLGKDTIADLLKPANKQKLADILKYHVVAGKVMSPVAVKLKAAQAISGKTIAVNFDGKALRVAGAKVIKADVEAQNGVIHVVDTVMLPPATPNLVEAANAAGQFATLLAAAKAAGLADTLSKGGPFTIFAPTDAAFAKLGKDTIATLLKPENKQQLQDILKYHVVAGTVPSATAIKLSEAKTLSGASLGLKFDGKTLHVGNAKVIKADVTASNGVIHVIDTVLLPTND
ncbi:MAG: fasciclin domain-containing protein [bacterium]|nr:fasciclin domain-containing protein [bacterium]